MSRILIPSTGNHVFCNSMFSLEIFSTHLTLMFFKCLLHMKKHLYEVIPVTFVERSSRLNGKSKNLWKKSKYNILVPNERYQDFWQLLQNPKFHKNVLGFSNHAQRFTPPHYLDVDNPFKVKGFWIFLQKSIVGEGHSKAIQGVMWSYLNYSI